MSWSSGKATMNNAGTSSAVSAGKGKAPQTPVSDDTADQDVVDVDSQAARSDGQMLTTLALLQTLHAHTTFQLSTLDSFLPRGGAETDKTVYITPKDMVTFELGPLSGFDARYLQWLAQEYAAEWTVVIKRGWKDLFGAMIGYG